MVSPIILFCEVFMRYIKQHDERDCGAACLAMIADFYGLKYPLQRFRDLTKTDRNGTNIFGLVDGAEKIGLRAEGLSGSAEEMMREIKSGDIKFPFIAHIISEDGFEHFIVVEKIGNGKVKSTDPAKGKRIISFEHFSAMYTGYLVNFALTDRFIKGNFTKGGFVKFFSLLHGQYSKLAAIIVLSIAVSFIGMLGAFVFETVLDDFVYDSSEVTYEEDHEHTAASNDDSDNILLAMLDFVNDNADKFNTIFIMLIGLYLLQAGIQYARGLLISKLSQKIDKTLILSYVEHIVDIPLEAVNSRNTGEYLSRFADTANIREAISGATITLLMDTLMVIFCGFLLFNENKVLFFVSLIMIVIYAIIVTAFRKPIKSINQDVMSSNANVQSYLKETISGIETIQAKNAQQSVKYKFRRKCGDLINKIFKGNMLYISQNTLTMLAETAGSVIVLWIGFGMVLEGAVTAGSIMTFYALLAFFIEPIKNLIELQPMLQTAIVAAERLNDIMDTHVEDQEGVPVPDQPEIKFKNVSFRYGNRDLVIKDLSFSVKEGEKIAIVGESGCGKTTIAKLLLGFYCCEGGEISIGNASIKDISKSDLRRKISYVSQETFLFSDTIKENIRFGNSNITDGEIKSACVISAADNFIGELPQKYDALIDENGSNLSGGQKQRLAIAGALVNNPKIIIFDEATSSLDISTEQIVMNSIKTRFSNATMIFIAHRLSFTKKCDRIYVMDKGKIVEFGTYNELMSQKGKYYTMATSNFVKK